MGDFAHALHNLNEGTMEEGMLVERELFPGCSALLSFTTEKIITSSICEILIYMS